MKRWQIIAGVVALLVAIAGGWILFGPATASSDGPLIIDGSGVDGQPVGVAAPYTMNSVLLLNTGKNPAVIERVRLLGVAGPLRLIGILTRQVPDAEGRGKSPGEPVYPPVEYPAERLSELNVVPVPDTFAPDGTPLEGIQVYFGLEVPEPGIGRFEQVEVTYKVGGRRYREVYDRAVFMCAPAEQYFVPDVDVNCPTPEVEGDFGERTLPEVRSGGSGAAAGNGHGNGNGITVTPPR